MREEAEPRSADTIAMQNQNEPPAARTVGPGPGMEIELKLSGQPERLKSAFASTAISARATGRGQTKRLENVYYDTDDQRLRARGLAFRVRKDGRRYYQTLKSNDAGGLAAYRGEWQTPLRSSEPDLALMPAGAAAVLDGLVKPDELKSLFTTRVQRLVRRIHATDDHGRSSLVEAALDLGSIECNGSSLPIAEVELELLEGSPAALYALALELDALAPLHVETRSKSARGYALAAGMGPAWHKAQLPALDRHATVDDAIQAILRSCIEQWSANEAAAHDGGDPEGVHQMRVAIRRLRSGFSVFGRLLDPEARAWLSGEAKAIVSSLGPARDWDVFLTELLAPVRSARSNDAQLARLAEAAETARAKGYAQARAAIEAPSYTRYLLQLGQWIEARRWRDGATERGHAWLDRPIVDFAAHVLGKRHRKALGLGRHFADLAAGERHQVRIALKKLRYASEFFQALFSKRHTKPYLGALKELQDDLGHLNDVAVAEQLIGSLIDHAAGEHGGRLRTAGGLVLGWHARGAVDLEPRAVRAWNAFAQRHPFWH
jgi:inorganic triphosphatase YgiF